MHNLFNTVCMKHFSVLIFVPGNFTLESDLARKRFEQHATEKLVAVKGYPTKDNNLASKCN